MIIFQNEAMLLLALLCLTVTSLAFIFTKVSILPDSDSNRTSTVDGLRGILALSVMAHHFYITYIWKTAGDWEKPESIVIDNFGAVAVSLFFLITGYLFISKIRKRQSVMETTLHFTYQTNRSFISICFSIYFGNYITQCTDYSIKFHRIPEVGE